MAVDDATLGGGMALGAWHGDAALASVARGGAAFGTVVQLSAAVSPSVVRLFAAMLLLMTVGAAL